MPGLDITLQLQFSDPGNVLPSAHDDAILTTGSLVLIDLSHPVNPVSGVPANGAAIPNIAWKEAQAALAAAGLGSSVQSDWNLAFNDNMVKTAGADGTIERSSKGGLHVIASQATESANRGIHIGSDSVASKLNTYLYNNPNHDYYLSRWERITRIGIANATELPVGVINNVTGSATANFLINQNRATDLGAGISRLNDPTLPAPVGNSFRSSAVTDWSGTLPASAADIRNMLVMVGNRGSFGVSPNNNKSRSAIIYRVYLEDLTVSGRTFAQAEDFDHSLWVQEMTTGGRFAGDTFTAPSSYP